MGDKREKTVVEWPEEITDLVLVRRDCEPHRGRWLHYLGLASFWLSFLVAPIPATLPLAKSKQGSFRAWRASASIQATKPYAQQSHSSPCVASESCVPVATHAQTTKVVPSVSVTTMIEGCENSLRTVLQAADGLITRFRADQFSGWL